MDASGRWLWTSFWGEHAMVKDASAWDGERCKLCGMDKRTIVVSSAFFNCEKAPCSHCGKAKIYHNPEMPYACPAAATERPAGSRPKQDPVVGAPRRSAEGVAAPIDVRASAAPSVVIHSFGYRSDASTAGPDFVADFSTHGLQGKTLRVCVFILYDGDQVTNSAESNRYKTSDGKLTVQTEVTPAYEHTRFQDFSQWIPWGQFYNAKGRVNYTAKLEIQHGGRSLAHMFSDVFFVDRTGSATS